MDITTVIEAPVRNFSPALVMTSPAFVFGWIRAKYKYSSTQYSFPGTPDARARSRMPRQICPFKKRHTRIQNFFSPAGEAFRKTPVHIHPDPANLFCSLRR